MLAASISATAQAPNPADPCPLGRAQVALRGLGVQAQLFTNGNLFFGGTTTNGAGYLVPFNAGTPERNRSPLYAANLWVGGTVDGTARSAGSTFYDFQLRPGAAGPDGTPPTPAACADADRIWVVSRYDVEQYLRTGVATADLADWPVALGAPVLDGDGVAGNYSLADGDQPALRGDVMAFWAMTDLAYSRDPVTLPGEGPLGVDVTVEAFAFLTPQPMLAQTTVYRFTVTNRNPVPIDSTRIGLWLDEDLGNASDDFIGTDTTHALLYTYNADDDDEGVTGYGLDPPAFGMTVLDSPPGADGRPLGLTATRWYPNGSSPQTTGQPRTSRAIRNALRGRWNDGTLVRERGDGYNQPVTAPATPYAFPGDPVTGQPWSEVNNGSPAPINAPGNRFMIGSTGPVQLAPGASAVFSVALVFGQGTDRFDSITALRRAASTMRRLHDAGRFEAQPVEGIAVPRVRTLQILRPAPNPFVGTTRLTLLDLDGLDVRVRVLDVLGREVQRLDLVPTLRAEPVEIGAGLAPGVYVVRVSGNAFDATITAVKSR